MSFILGAPPVSSFDGFLPSRVPHDDYLFCSLLSAFVATKALDETVSNKIDGYILVATKPAGDSACNAVEFEVAYIRTCAINIEQIRFTQHCFRGQQPPLTELQGLVQVT